MLTWAYLFRDRLVDLHDPLHGGNTTDVTVKDCSIQFPKAYLRIVSNVVYNAEQESKKLALALRRCRDYDWRSFTDREERIGLKQIHQILAGPGYK